MGTAPSWYEDWDPVTEQVTTEHVVDGHLRRLIDVVADLVVEHSFLAQWGDGYGGYPLLLLVEALSDRGIEPEPGRPSVTMLSRLFERDGPWCWYCGTPVGGPHFPVAHADHVVPKARGGVYGISNRVVACERCNRRKGARPADEFLAEIRAEVVDLPPVFPIPRRPGWDRES